jgi:hypothetical protein
MLVGVQNVAPARKNPTRHAGDKAGLVRTVKKSDVGGIHAIETDSPAASVRRGASFLSPRDGVAAGRWIPHSRATHVPLRCPRMKLPRLLPHLIGCLTFAAAITAARADAVFQFGFFAPDLQLVDSTANVSGLRIDFVYGENADVSGLDLGVVNSTTGDFLGLGWAVGGNLVDGNATGIQWSWLYSHTGGTFAGWQTGLVARASGAGSIGLQSGWINLAEKDFSGVQFGLLNRAETFKGLQLGFVNMAEYLDGLQIGLVNYAGNSDVYKILPIVNWQF